MARSVIGAFLAFLLAAMVAWSASLRVDGPLVSTVADVAPFEVASTTKVTNLNADLLDGRDASDFATQTQVAAIYNQILFPMDATFVVPQGVQVLEITVTGAGGGGAGGGIEQGGSGGGGSLLAVASPTRPRAPRLRDVGRAGTRFS